MSTATLIRLACYRLAAEPLRVASHAFILLQVIGPIVTKGCPARLPTAGGMMPSYLAGLIGMNLAHSATRRPRPLAHRKVRKVDAIPDAVHRPRLLGMDGE